MLGVSLRVQGSVLSSVGQVGEGPQFVLISLGGGSGIILVGGECDQLCPPRQGVIPQTSSAWYGTVLAQLVAWRIKPQLSPCADPGVCAHSLFVGG